MSLINVSNLTFAYDGGFDNIFENASFQIDTDWRLGFVGRNGRGKTTFLNLLLGKYEYSGIISSNVGFEYFPYEIPDTMLETLDVLQSISGGVERWALIRELSLLDMREDALYRPFGTLSGGERTKAMLAAMFLKENSFMLIDEPTNHLDMRAREKLGNYLKTKSGFILVSHDRVFLDNCVNHILAINRADIEVRRGNFTSWWEDKQKRDSFELAENERLKKDVKRLEASARRTSNWSDEVEKTKHGSKNSGLRVDRGYVGHKAAKMMSRSKSIEARRLSAVEEKSKLLKNIETADNLKITPLTYHSQRLAEFNRVSLSYGSENVCEGISFTVERGDRVALCGGNGSGKSSIIRRILGDEISSKGDVRVGSGLKISYVPQDASFLRGNLSDFAMEREIDESLFKAILRKLDFSRAQFEKDMSDFSGGQKKKTLIAGSLCERAHLYIWDEPLNFIDLFSRMQIEELLRGSGITLLFVEHDAAFRAAISTKEIQL